MRAEVASALYAASATQAAFERAADARLRAAQAEIARLAARGASARAELIAAQEAYVADLTQRDRAYAQEIGVFRAAVTDIASTPEGAAALARFNAGDEIGALAVLDQLRAARDRARQVRANLESAAEGRRIATLALEARARGRLDTQSVIVRYESVTLLDPNLHWDWIELTRLYIDAGRLYDAEQSARRALEIAVDPLDGWTSLIDLADVLSVGGALAAARPLLEQSLAIAQREYAETPGPATRRDLSIALSRMGDMKLGMGDISASIQHYNDAMTLDQQTYRETASLESARDICIDILNLSDAIVALGDLPTAARYMENAIGLCGRIANDSDTGEDQLQLGYALWRRANISAVQGDLDFARSELQALSVFADEALRTDPANNRLAVQTRLLELGFADIEILSGQLELARNRLHAFISDMTQTRERTGFDSVVDSYIWLAQVRLSVLPDSEETWTALRSRSAPVIALADLSALDWHFIRLSEARSRE